MRKVFAATVVAFLASLGLALVASPASAESAGVTVESACNTGWYVNPDETDRKPTQVEGGLEFSGADLVHHATDLALADLNPGTFALASGSGAPDQPSFFSVEVRDATTRGYGTLRWDGDEWTLVTNVDTFSHADPADFIGTETKWGELTSATKVISFGVGYTQNPTGTKTVVVSSVTFAGKTYTLGCKTVTPEKPTYTEPTCDKAGVVKLPTTDGVEYKAERIVKDGVTVQAKVTATAKDGYVLKDAVDGKVVFGPYDVAQLDPKQCVVPQRPETQDPTCDTPPQYQDGTDEVTYTHEGLPYGDNWYTVKAVAKDGYAIKPGATTEWRIDIKWPTGCSQTPTPNPTPNPGGGNGGGETPSAAPSTSNVAAGGELPVTGSSKSTMLYLLGGGLMLVAIGGGAVLYARRNRDEVEFTS